MFLRHASLGCAILLLSGCGIPYLWPPREEQAIAQPVSDGCQITVQTRVWTRYGIISGRATETARFTLPSIRGTFQAKSFVMLITSESGTGKAHIRSGSVSIDDSNLLIDIVYDDGYPSDFNGKYLVANNGCGT